MAREGLAPGLRGEAKLVVREEDIAQHFGSGNVTVLAAPRMTALMDEGCGSSLAPLARLRWGARSECAI